MDFDQIANAMKTKNSEFRYSAKIGNDIHVERDESALWQVYGGDQRMSVVSFRCRGYAMAFARAVAFSRHVEMLVHETDGRITRHKRASLTYPISLN